MGESLGSTGILYSVQVQYLQYEYSPRKYMKRKMPDETTICPALYSAPTYRSRSNNLMRVREYAVANALFTHNKLSTSVLAVHTTNAGKTTYLC